MDHIELLDLPRAQEPPANLEDFFQNSPIFQDRPAGFTVELAFAPDMRAALERAFQLTDVGTLTDSRDDAGARSLPAEYLFRIPANWLYGRCKVPESLWFRSQLRGMGARVIILSPEHMRSSYRAELKEYPLPGLLS
jgi:predicted DNA-binding transcriptional regulator YafY